MDSVNKHRESQEDSGSKPRAARNEMPGEKDSRTLSAPTGLRRCSPCRQATTPSGLAISFPLSPRVARASQHRCWAGGHNPFGIGNGYRVRFCDSALPILGRAETAANHFQPCRRFESARTCSQGIPSSGCFRSSSARRSNSAKRSGVRSGSPISASASSSGLHFSGCDNARSARRSSSANCALVRAESLRFWRCLDDLALPTAISYRFQKDNQAPPSMRAIKTFGQPQQYKSGRGQPHSKTCRIFDDSELARSVLECGCPLPLSRSSTRNARQF